jgi:hypothetical protein
MPKRSREINDQLTEARVNQLIKAQIRKLGLGASPTAPTVTQSSTTEAAGFLAVQRFNPNITEEARRWSEGAGSVLHDRYNRQLKYEDAINMFSGGVIETIDIDVVEDTGTVYARLQADGGGDLRFIILGEVYYLDCTPSPAEVALTAGTDTAPQINYVYVTKSGVTLTLEKSTTGWPATAHAPICTAIVQSAASLATDGAMKVHAWTDHLAKDNENGHLSHINKKLRSLAATWVSGVTPADMVAGQISTSAGVVFQVHEHTFPARDMSTGDPVWVVNDSDAAYTRITDFDGGGIDKLSDGTAIGNNKYINIILWGVVSEDDPDCKLMVNLPSGQDTSSAASQIDAANYADYAIPIDYVGTGFLIARYTMQYNTAAGGSWTPVLTTDLRGFLPASSAGGGAVGDHGALTGLLDVTTTSPVLRAGPHTLTCGNRSGV